MTYTYVMTEMIKQFSKQDFFVARQLQEMVKQPNKKILHSNRS